MTALIGLGLVAVAGVVVGVLVLLGVGATSAVHSLVTDDGDRTTVVGGSGWNAARTSRDGRTLVLALTGSAPYASGNPCTSDLSATAEESDQSVTVTVTARSPKVDREFGCSGVGYLRLVEVPLEQPLAGRTVVDSDGVRHEVFDGTALLDPVVPDGWTLTSEGDGGSWPDARPSWVRTWAPETKAGSDLPPSPCVGGPSGLVVSQGASDLFDWASTHGERVGTAEVHGHDAVVMKGPFGDDLSVTWADGASGFAVAAQLRCGDDVPMPLDELLAYARSLA